MPRQSPMRPDITPRTFTRMQEFHHGLQKLAGDPQFQFIFKEDKNFELDTPYLEKGLKNLLTHTAWNITTGYICLKLYVSESDKDKRRKHSEENRKRFSVLRNYGKEIEASFDAKLCWLEETSEDGIYQSAVKVDPNLLDIANDDNTSRWPIIQQDILTKAKKLNDILIKYLPHLDNPSALAIMMQPKLEVDISTRNTHAITDKTQGAQSHQTNASVQSIITLIAPAVFIRNHHSYIEAACKRNRESQLRQTTFRSSKLWTSARLALKIHKVLTCYLAPIGGNNTVQYQAVIHQIHLHPKLMDPVTQELLGMELDATKKEGLWESDGKAVNTLYTIAQCEKLSASFPITELVKIDGNEPISENYGYGYSLVYEHSQPADEVLLISPEETPYESDLYEGTPRKSSITARQRSAAARQKCLDQYGCVCSVCAFDFAVRYGTLGTGFIHVHHLNPMAKSKERRKVNPLEDLRPICPNCHAMIHHRDPELSITELMSMLNKNH